MELVSVLMSVYNENLVWIQESLESILNQTYENIEVILVVDNPSIMFDVKNYLEIIQEKDSRLKVIYNSENLGLALSLNVGLENARGSLIARMDADDFALPERFERQVNFLKSQPKIALVGTGRYLMSENGVVNKDYETPVCGADKIKKVLPCTSCIVHPSIMIWTEVLKKVGGYRNFRQSQDYDLWLRLSSSGYQMDNIDEPLMLYRLRDNGISLKKPYLQYLTARYQRKMYKIRMRRGEDSFSEKNFQRYIEKYDGHNEKKNNKFIISKNLLEMGIHEIKYKNLKGLFYIIKAVFCFPENFKLLMLKTKILVERNIGK